MKRGLGYGCDGEKSDPMRVTRSGGFPNETYSSDIKGNWLKFMVYLQSPCDSLSDMTN